MKKILKLVVTIFALASGSVANAGLIDFENLGDQPLAPYLPSFMTHADEIQIGGYWIDTFSTKGGAQGVDLVGMMVDGSDLANTCSGLICPSNNTTNFLAALDDGLVDVGQLNGEAFRLRQFDASFIAFPGLSIPGTAMILQVEGYSGLNLVALQQFALSGPVGGAYNFATFKLNTDFGNITEVAFRGFACDALGTCTRTVDSAQFGLDNLVTGTAPEPAGIALFGLGLAAAWLVRRRRAA